jgi:hypothetical protein
MVAEPLEPLDQGGATASRWKGRGTNWVHLAKAQQMSDAPNLPMPLLICAALSYNPGKGSQQTLG